MQLGILMYGFLCLAGIVISAGLITIGALLAIKGHRNHSNRRLICGLLICFGTVLTIILFLCQDSIIPLKTQAGDLMSLPTSAEVIAVEKGETGGSVTFRLTANKPVILWFPVIWHMNEPSHTDVLRKSTNHWEWNSFAGPDIKRDLTYDPVKAQYCYTVDYDS